YTLPRPRDEASATAQPQRVYPVEHDLEQKIRRAMAPYSPAYMVIDRQHTVQHFSGGSAGAYLEPSDGAASFNLFTLLKKALRSAAREIISRAMANDQTVTRDDLALHVNGQRRMIQLIVTPLATTSGRPSSF